MAYPLSTVKEHVHITGPFKLSSILECPDAVTCVQHTELLDNVFIGCMDGGIRVLKDGKFIMNLKEDNIPKANCSITGMKHHAVSKNLPVTNTLTCTYKCGFVKFWNYNFQTCISTLEENRETMGISFHKKLAKFATFGNNAKIYLYDEDSKKQERVLTASEEKGSSDGHTGTVMSAAFHPTNANELISGGLDNTVQFWDTRQPNATRRIHGVTITGDGIDFSPKGTEFITCGNPGNPFQIWDYGSGKLLKTIDVDKFAAAPLKCGKFCSRSHVVCGGGSPNILRIVNVYNYKEEALISNIIQPVNSISVGKPVNNNDIPQIVFSAGKRIYSISPK